MTQKSNFADVLVLLLKAQILDKGETSAAIRAAYALVGVDVGKASEEHYIEPLEGLYSAS